LSKKETILDTQYIQEKRWIAASRDEILKMILEEMPETDAEGTLAYLLSETDKGKVVTLGSCRFKRH